VKFTQAGDEMVRFAATAAICCNWLQLFHTKARKETKRKAEVES
jgi:hypothetical protein